LSLKWIGFDLDDTLHRFTSAAHIATAGVFEHIRSRHPELALHELEDRYKQIRKEYVTSFTDGRPSRLYRLERMQQLLKRSGLALTAAEELVDIYKQGLERSLTLEEGALDLLKSLKQDGHKLAVITEGPHDAQEWTIQQLGLSKQIDRLFTSNKERVSKKDGLFNVLMGHVNAQPFECLIVGDSIEHDIKPATKAGLKTIYFNRLNTQAHPIATYTVHHLQDVLTIVRQSGGWGTNHQG
jgi:putative hydrolase of the HAD superfamily